MHLPQKKSHPILLMLLLSLLAACSPAQVSPSPTAQPPVAAASHNPAPSQTTAPTATEPPTAIPPTPTATATPAPSETPSPSPSPTPEAVTALTLRWVDVYAGPGEAYPVMASFAENIRFLVTGHNTSGDWLQVKLSTSVRGWISKINLEISGDENTAALVEIPAAPDLSPTPPINATANIWAIFNQFGGVQIQVSGLIPGRTYTVKVESEKGRVVLNESFTSSAEGALPKYHYLTLSELRVGVYTIRLYQ
jgi:hypothetical protein